MTFENLRQILSAYSGRQVSLGTLVDSPERLDESLGFLRVFVDGNKAIRELVLDNFLLLIHHAEDGWTWAISSSTDPATILFHVQIVTERITLTEGSSDKYRNLQIAVEISHAWGIPTQLEDNSLFWNIYPDKTIASSTAYHNLFAIYGSTLGDERVRNSLNQGTTSDMGKIILSAKVVLAAFNLLECIREDEKENTVNQQS